MFLDCELLSVIAVTESHINDIPPDPFSQATGSWIRVRGYLYPALLYVADNHIWDLKYDLVIPQTVG